MLAGFSGGSLERCFLPRALTPLGKLLRLGPSDTLLCILQGPLVMDFFRVQVVADATELVVDLLGKT